MLKKILWLPGQLLASAIYRHLFLNLYKAGYWFKKIRIRIIPLEKIKPVYLFINQYIVHILMIGLVLLISFANFFTAETKAETFGEKSLLYTLTTGSDAEDQYIEETLASTTPQITSYMESDASAVAAPQQIYTNQTPTVEETGIAISSDSAALVKPELASIEGAKLQRDKIIEYTVVGGDTLSTISQGFGISVETLLWENNLTKLSMIKPGQKLVILPTSGISYKIAKGDTLDKIAKKYQAEKSKILDFNRLANDQDVKVGEIIIIPEGKPYYTPAPPQKQLASITKIFAPKSYTPPKITDDDQMLWPTVTHRISQFYNWRHTGLDIDGEFGDPIWAAEAGIITKSVCMKTGYGCHVIIDHGGGKTTLYGHFQKLYVKEGQTVAKGDVLGEEGSTGKSTGSHLHFEVRYNLKRFNPLNYIK